MPRRWLPRLSGAGWLLFATCAVRMVAYGSISVVLGLYLASRGLDPGVVGAVFTVALVGGAGRGSSRGSLPRCGSTLQRFA